MLLYDHYFFFIATELNELGISWGLIPDKLGEVRDYIEALLGSIVLNIHQVE